MMPPLSPIPLRLLFASHPKILGPILKITHRVISVYLKKKAGIKGSAAHTGAVTLIQRFGSAINLNIHFHCLVLDGVYIKNGEFRSVPSPSSEELQDILQKLVKRILNWLTLHGYLVQEQGQTYVEQGTADAVLIPLQSASCTYRIAFGPRAGKKVLTLQTVPNTDIDEIQSLCTQSHGFSLHAATRCGMNQRHKLEHLCRYITRPAIANHRLKINHAGQVIYELKTPYRNGTTHVVFSPLELMQRLAALVPRPRLNLIRFHGVLAPHAQLRPKIVPNGSPGSTIMPEEHTEGDRQPTPHSRIQWAQLLKRVFDIDITICSSCGGSLKIIAAIEEPQAIKKILNHLGLSAQPPPRTPALYTNH
jgi:hypothetical protein